MGAVHPVPEVGWQITIFFLACVAVAGVVGAITVSRRSSSSRRCPRSSASPSPVWRGDARPLGSRRRFCSRANIVMIIIRAPHGNRSRTVGVAKSRAGRCRDRAAHDRLALVRRSRSSGSRPLLRSPTIHSGRLPLAAGIACLAAGLWFLHRSHADLGTNWSITLEVREKHQLVTTASTAASATRCTWRFFLYSLGQALAVPNWVAGPSYLVAFGLLVALRLGPEERMMREEFGADYDAYAARTAGSSRGSGDQSPSMTLPRPPRWSRSRPPPSRPPRRWGAAL